MKLYNNKRQVGEKEYDSFKISLSKREAHLLRKLGGEFEIYDIDEKTGQVWLKRKQMNTTGECSDPVASFRLHVDDVEWEGFKEECRRRGLTVCWVLSGFVRACNQVPDLVEHPGGVKNVYVFMGKPRSRHERLLWERKGVEG